MLETVSPVTARLSPDAAHLEVWLDPSAAQADQETLAARIGEQCADLGLALALTHDDIAARLAACPVGCWHRLLSATPAGAPLNGRVELLVPVPVSTQSGHRQGESCSVHTGTPLARLSKGVSGQPGCDLLGRVMQARVPREARLPQGENTAPSKDGVFLLAMCDGEVVLRDLLLHVHPAGLHRGDLTAAHGALRSETGVFVTGSVRPGAHIDAEGDVHIQGDVNGAQVMSRQGSITVGGDVGGTAAQRSELYASKDVSCHSLLYADVAAVGNLHLQKGAWSSGIRIGGDLFLRGSIESCLAEVQVEVGGAVALALDAPAPLAAVPTERQHVRVAAQMPAHIAPHGLPPLTFLAGVVEDISVSGARFRLKAPSSTGDPSCGAIMQLKFTPPDDQGQVLAVARVARVIAPGMLGLTFMQMSHRDRERLQKICRQLVLSRKQVTLGTRADRKRDD